MLLVKLAIYELLEIIPCALLAAAPFRNEVHSSKKLTFAIFVLYCLGIVRRFVILQQPGWDAVLSVIWILLYLLAFRIVYYAKLSKILFVLITVLNFASFITISYIYVGDKLFNNQLHADPYGISACITLASIWILFFPLLYKLMRNKLAPMISSQINESCWRSLWLMPVTFCIFFYYNLYTSGSIFSFSSNTRNFIFAMVISAGFLFVLSLVLRLVRESNLVLQLKSENYQMTLQTLQYKNLQGRIAETRRARHDLRQCMTVIQSFLQSGNRAELQRFIAQYCTTLPPDTFILHSKNSALNAILSYYEECAIREEIKFSTKIEYPESGVIQDTEIVVLIGNLLENAIEACMLQTETERFIRLAIQLAHGSLVIVMDNSYDSTPISTNEVIQSSKHSGVGIGLDSIQKIASAHGGTVKFQGDGKIFHSSVLLFQVDNTNLN